MPNPFFPLIGTGCLRLVLEFSTSPGESRVAAVTDQSYKRRVSACPEFLLSQGRQVLCRVLLNSFQSEIDLFSAAGPVSGEVSCDFFLSS